jgi:hypothetical protein
LRRGHIAEIRPAAGERQRFESAAAFSDEPQSGHPDPCRKPVKPRPLGKERPQAQTRSKRRRRQMPRKFALAPMPH